MIRFEFLARIGFSDAFLPLRPRIPTLARMFAIVEIAGFQEKVQKGLVLEVPLLPHDVGAKVVFDKVLLTADGDDVKIETPHLAGASVEVKVLAHGKGDKIRVVKMQRRKRFRRVKGHRQRFTRIEVMKVG